MSPPPVVGICTDSTALLPDALVARFGVAVVPVVVAIDGEEHLEGVDLGPDAFYDRYRRGPSPQIDVTAPSPGQFAAAYEELLARGCTGILSVHGAATLPSTLTAARIAARSLPVPVRVADATVGGFGAGCAVWAAAEAIARGATLDEAANAVEQMPTGLGNVFVMCPPTAAASADAGRSLPVLTLRCGSVEELDRAESGADAVHRMASHVLGWGQRLRIGVGHSCTDSAPVADALEDALSAAANVVELVRYRIGPSSGRFTGPGVAGCFVFPG